MKLRCLATNHPRQFFPRAGDGCPLERVTLLSSADPRSAPLSMGPVVHPYLGREARQGGEFLSHLWFPPPLMKTSQYQKKPGVATGAGAEGLPVQLPLLPGSGPGLPLAPLRSHLCILRREREPG